MENFYIQICEIEKNKGEKTQILSPVLISSGVFSAAPLDRNISSWSTSSIRLSTELFGYWISEELRIFQCFYFDIVHSVHHQVLSRLIEEASTSVLNQLSWKDL